MTTVYSSLAEIYSVEGDYKKYSEVLNENAIAGFHVQG